MSDMFDDMIKQDRTEKRSTRLSATKEDVNRPRTSFGSNSSSSPSNFNVEELDIGRKRSIFNLRIIIPIIVFLIIIFLAYFVFGWI